MLSTNQRSQYQGDYCYYSTISIVDRDGDGESLKFLISCFEKKLKSNSQGSLVQAFSPFL